jgi:hypothetical protein
MLAMPTSSRGNDRRSKARFPLRRELSYRLLDRDSDIQSGTGYTIDVSSAGICFEADRDLQRGAFVDLSISWPALLDQTCPIRLTVLGRVLRSTGRQGVCSVDRYEFRTQSRTVSGRPEVGRPSRLERWAEAFQREKPLKAARSATSRNGLASGAGLDP